MVSLRCKILVKEELSKLGIECVSIDLGVVDSTHHIEEEKLQMY